MRNEIKPGHQQRKAAEHDDKRAKTETEHGKVDS